jgi:hypothetical protein
MTAGRSCQACAADDCGHCPKRATVPGMPGFVAEGCCCGRTERWDRTPQRAAKRGSRHEQPAGVGHAQLRPALLGWQWRISFHGQVFCPWVFQLGPQAAARRAVGAHHPTRIEVLP